MASTNISTLFRGTTATTVQAQDLTLAFAIASTDPNEDGVTWLDSATVAEFPEASAKDMLWNRSGGAVILSGVDIANGERWYAVRATAANVAANWAKWSGDATAIAPTNVAPTFVVGNPHSVGHRNAIHSGLIPLDGQTITNVEAEYPDWWKTIIDRSGGYGVESYDETAKTVVMKDYNGIATGMGRYERGGATAGVEQADATAVNGLRIAKSNVNWDWTTTTSSSVSKSSGPNALVNDAQSLSSTDTETRPISVTVIRCIIVKPWNVDGDVTISVINPVEVKTTLIDAEPSNGDFLTFAGGRTMESIESEFSEIQIFVNTSRSGVNSIQPYGFTLPADKLREWSNLNGFRIATINGVTIDVDPISLTATGVTYRQSGGDAPTSGRMQFVMTGIRDTTIGITGAKGDNGKSIYQIWLDEGNTGTEAEFLDSIRESLTTTSIYSLDGIRNAQTFEPTSNAESFDVNIGGSGDSVADVEFAYKLPQAAPFTIQIRDGVTATTGAIDIAVDGTASQNATDASEITMAVTVDDFTEVNERRVTVKGTHPSTFVEQPIFRVWGNVIGAPQGLINLEYAVREKLLDGVDGQGIDHISTDTTTSPPTVTAWGDAAETNNLGSFQTAISEIHDWQIAGNNATVGFPAIPDIEFEVGTNGRQIRARSRTGANVTLSQVWNRWEQSGEGQFQATSVTLVPATWRNLSGRDTNFSVAGAAESVYFLYDGRKHRITMYVDNSWAQNMLEIWVEQ